MSKLANFLIITRQGLEDQIDFRDEYASWNPERAPGPEELYRMTVSDPDDLFEDLEN